MISIMKITKKTRPAPKAASKIVAATGAISAKKKTTSAKPVRKGSAAVEPPAPKQVTEVEIATRAYFIYESEGCPAGRELDHWLEAEAQLRGR
jgi:hypothetical protein